MEELEEERIEQIRELRSGKVSLLHRHFTRSDRSLTEQIQALGGSKEVPLKRRA